MVKTTETTFKGSDGTQVELYVATPDSGRAPAVIVTHEIWGGLEDQIRGCGKEVCRERLRCLCPLTFTRGTSRCSRPRT
ncbi:dienelactone hydrolase family protein [Thermogymnomonas acidicola]|uniref:dienelactone hydrolase family protein n=1 Tax=Thermogymnomonas acidicola TaxID=399579 RepID=UPI001396AC20|nr:dienelactone hydrolase family protein [Thermogymnomonas acidicola]